MYGATGEDYTITPPVVLKRPMPQQLWKQGRCSRSPIEEDEYVSAEHDSLSAASRVQPNLHSGSFEPWIVLSFGGLRWGHSEHAQPGRIGQTSGGSGLLRTLVSRRASSGPWLRRCWPTVRPLGLPGLHGCSYVGDSAWHRIHCPPCTPSSAHGQGISQRRSVERRSLDSGCGFRRSPSGVFGFWHRSRKARRHLSRALRGDSPSPQHQL
ncbi:hypothetical protein D3C75_824190 [compost metagenome]